MKTTCEHCGSTLIQSKELFAEIVHYHANVLIPFLKRNKKELFTKKEVEKECGKMPANIYCRFADFSHWGSYLSRREVSLPKGAKKYYYHVDIEKAELVFANKAMIPLSAMKDKLDGNIWKVTRWGYVSELQGLQNWIYDGAFMPYEGVYEQQLN